MADSITTALAQIATVRRLARMRDERAAASRTSAGEPTISTYGPPEGWRPSPRQQEFLDCTDDEALYGGAAGGGKTAALLLDALRDVHVPGYAAVIIRRTRPELTQPDGPIPLSHEWLDGKAAWNGSDYIWRFPSGATLSFGFMQDPQDHLRYQGGGYQFAGFDELTQIREYQYRYVFSRMRKRVTMGGVLVRTRATANPGGPGHEWVKKRFGLSGIPTSTIHVDGVDEDGAATRRTFIPARLDDNPGLDKAAYRKQLRKLDATTRAQLEHGNWDAVAGGRIFARAPQTYSVLPTEGLTWGIGLDGAYSKRTASDFAVIITGARGMAQANGHAAHPVYYVTGFVRRQCLIGDFERELTLALAAKPTARRRWYVGGQEAALAAMLEQKIGLGSLGATTTAGDDKIARAQGVARAWNGRDPDPGDPTDHGEPACIYLPENAAWSGELISELTQFPDGEHDDVPDALSAWFDVLNAPTVSVDDFATDGPRLTAGMRKPTGLRGGGW